MAKNIIITGASSGLGAALALRYATTVPDVTLGLLGRDAIRLEQVANMCRTHGATAVTATIDVTHTDDMTAWLVDFDAAHPVDLVIANAGISGGTGGGNSESITQIHSIFDINIKGLINTIHPLIEHMKMRKQGKIALVSSIAGFRGAPTAPAYSTSKAAVRVYGQALQGLLAPHGICVSVICPGFIKTPMTDINPFPMPFLMTAENAAKLIQHRLAKRHHLIIFPWIMGIVARAQNWLPDRLINALYNRIPAKPPS